MADAFEIVIPYLTTNEKHPMLTWKVYAYTREEVDTFIRQYKIRFYDVNILYAEQIGKDYDERDVLKEYTFVSNQDGNKYTLLSTESIIYDAVEYIAEKLSETLIFGSAILKTDIPIIDIINRLIETLKHTSILDYSLLDDDFMATLDDIEEMNVRGHIRTFSNKIDELEDWPDENDRMYSYIFDSLHNASILYGTGPEPITLEGYIEYMATMLTDSI